MNDRHVVIGTAGHVDHGKTRLIHALTGIDTDRLAEEKKRGITIELGFAWLDLPDGGRAGIIDVPGHERFIRNMLAGVGGIDLALMVIAADEGVMPQTREHLGILSLLGVSHGVIALTKTDLTAPDWLELAQEEVRSAVAGTFLEDAPILPVSAQTGAGIEALRQCLFEMAEQSGEKRLDRAFRMPIDRVFSKAGFGSVITGTLLAGSLCEGQTVMVYPAGASAKVRTLQVHNQNTARVVAGQRAAVNLTGIRREALERGCVLAQPNSIPPSNRLDVALRMLPDAAFAVKNASRLHFYCGTQETLCKVQLFGTDRVEAGGEAYAQLRFEQEIAVQAGDRFIVRFFSPTETIGGGIVIDPCPAKHRRSDPHLLRMLERMRFGTPADRLDEAERMHSRQLTPLDEIGRQLNLTPNELTEAVHTLAESGKLVRIHGNLCLHRTYLNALGAQAEAILDDYHAMNPLSSGVDCAALRQKLLPRQETAVTDAVLLLFAQEKRIVWDGRMVRRYGFTRRYTSAQESIRSLLEAAYIDAGFAPPDKSELMAQVGGAQAAAPVFQVLCAEGALVETDERICFARIHFDEALRRFAALEAAHGAVTLAQFRDALGTSRKYAVSLLEYYDHSDITKKVGDARRLCTDLVDAIKKGTIR